jgi:hypothetical protein
MKVPAISLNGIYSQESSHSLKRNLGGSISLDKFKSVSDLSLMPYYYPISFTSIQNSSKLRALFKYDLPCIYSGKTMIDPKHFSKMLKSKVFERPSKYVVEILSGYKDTLSGVEERVTGIISARSKVHPDMNIHDLLSEIEPVYRRDLRKKQSGIFRNIKTNFENLPDEYRNKFKILMEETDKRLNERPVLIPFSSYEFKYKLLKIKDSIKIGENDLKSKKVVNKLIKESKRLNNNTNSNTIANQIKVMGMLDWILRKSVLKNNKDLQELIGTSKARLTNKEIIAPFSRKSFIYDLGRIVDDLPEEDKSKILHEAFKLPTSSQDFSAYMVKISGEPSEKIASRILWPYLASVEHIFPRSEGGADIMANFAGATTRENSLRKSIEFTEQMKLRPNTPYYCQMYVNKLIELYHKGVFEKNRINPKYIEDFKNTIYEQSKHKINLDISKFYERTHINNAIINNI